MAEIKIFGLRLKSGILKVHKFEAARAFADLSKRQAKMIQFSPDTKWLVTIRADNSILLYRRSETNKKTLSPLFLKPPVELKRLRRETSNTKAKDTSLGSYNRSINRIAFSADSRILAVSDLSGFLDTWVIEGQEDLGQANVDEASTAAGLDKFDSSDEEDSEGDNPITMFGEHWIRNPAASLIPKLPAAPLVLSFRPSTTQGPGTLTSGQVGVHPTRHNPHPHSHDLPNGEDRLLVLTAENQIYEFNVLSGRISDWSRRNPTSNLPQEFRDLKDRAKSAVWDLRGPNERIWLYGVSWLWMFDLSQDLTPVIDGQKVGNVTNGSSKEVSLKRKRGANNEEDIESRPRSDTGAGSKFSNAELGIGIGSKMRKIDGTDGAEGRWINVDAEQDSFSEGEGGYALAKELDQTLIKLRRGDAEIGGLMPNHHIDSSTDADTSENDDTRFAKIKDGKRPAYWHTYKYRPILGMVSLGGETGDEAAEDDDLPLGLEVALVERPLFDMDLPPRYFGDQEWDP